MPSLYTFQLFGDEIQLRSVFDRPESDQFQRVPEEQVEHILWQIMSADPLAFSVFLPSSLATIHGYPSFVSDSSTLLQQIQSAIKYGQLVLYRRKLQAYALHYQPPLPVLENEAPESAEPVKEVFNDWVEIELHDEGDSSQPIPHVEYVLELADGSKKHGQLNDQGWARVDGIKSGNCKISFPDLDQASWDVKAS